jgi:hypothetical protein
MVTEMWPELTASPLLADGKRLAGEITLTDVTTELQARHIPVYEFPYMNDADAHRMIKRMESEKKRSPKSLRYLAKAGAGERVRKAWDDLVHWVDDQDWADYFWMSLLGLVIYTYKGSSPTPAQTAYYTAMRKIKIDHWDATHYTPFATAMGKKKQFYETTGNLCMMNVPIQVAERWDRAF